MKLALQITLIVGGLGPLVIGLMSFAQGAAAHLQSGQIPIQLDAHLRALSIWFTVAFFLIVWGALNLETAGTALYIVFAVMALAGVARFYSMWSFGEWDSRTVVAAVVEMATLIFIPWHLVFMRSIGA